MQNLKKLNSINKFDISRIIAKIPNSLIKFDKKITKINKEVIRVDND